MKYLRFYKNRLPFKPTTSQVIYFDESAISIKLGHPVARFVDSNYAFIYNSFRRAGLEFCFLPRISSTLDIKELYRYFRPEATEEEIQKLRNANHWRRGEWYELANYALEASSILNDSRPGLIRYIGEDYDQKDFYIFSYAEFGEPNSGMNNGIDVNRYMRQLESYIDLNSEANSVFDRGYFYDDADALMTEAQLLVSRMRRNGIGEMVIKDIFRPTQMLSRLKVQGMRIFLCDYNNMEITMGPLPKTVYFLYLRHPEGIAFSEMENHYDELLSIYKSITGREDMQSIRNSILDLTIPESNSLNEKCSRIRQAFVTKINPDLARNYYVTGERGGRRRILLPREMVTFNEHSI